MKQSPQRIFIASILLAGFISSPMGVALASDAATAFPDLSTKKLLVGFWHQGPLTSAGYQQGTAAEVDLAAIPAEYNVITVAFMSGHGIPTFKPYLLSDAQFRQKVALLNREGRAVFISLGGAGAHIALKAGDAPRFAAEIIRLVEVYGVDGLDIDLKGRAILAAANQTEIPAALKMVKQQYPQFMISMTPEFPCLRTGAACETLIRNLAGYYDFISPQYYNQAAEGVAADDGYYAQNDDSKKAEFLYYLSDSLIHGTRGFIPIPADKLVPGLPGNPDAAENGYASNEADVRTALERLAAQGTPLKGLMTWSINWDNGHDRSGNRYGYSFARRYGALISEELASPPDHEAPSPPGKPDVTAVDGAVALKWLPATDNVGVTHYAIWRNGINIAHATLPEFTDRQVSAGDVHEYYIVAADNAGNLSPQSDAATIALDEELLTPATAYSVADYPAYQPGTAYQAGDRVRVAGGVYQCKAWPYSAWCAGENQAYAPLTGTHWQQVWDKLADAQPDATPVPADPAYQAKP